VLTIAITLLLFSVLKIGVYSEWILLVSIVFLLGLASISYQKTVHSKKENKQEKKMVV
jgi:hypothetical protein